MPSRFSILCPSCGSALRVRANQVGRTVACTSCAARFQVPDPESGEPVGIPEPPPPTRAGDRDPALPHKADLPGKRSADRRAAPPRLETAGAPVTTDEPVSEEAKRHTEALRGQTVLPERRSPEARKPRAREEKAAREFDDERRRIEETAAAEAAEAARLAAEEAAAEAEEAARVEAERLARRDPRVHRLNPNKSARLVSLDAVARETAAITPEWQGLGERDPFGDRAKRWTGKQLIVFGLALIAGVAGVTAFFTTRSGSLDSLDARPGAGLERAEAREMAELGRRGTAWLERFAATESITERAALVRHPEETLPRMERYYAASPDALRLAPSGDALAVDEFEREDKAFVGVILDFNDFTRRVAVFEVTPDGLRLDWESLVGFSEIPLGDLLGADPGTSGEFRIILWPDDYHNFAFDDRERYACFRIEDPDRTTFGWAYCERDSPAFAAAHRAVETSRKSGLREVEAVVRLSIPEPGEIDGELGPNQVRLDEFLRLGHLIP